jgi:hypothetical protein
MRHVSAHPTAIDRPVTEAFRTPSRLGRGNPSDSVAMFRLFAMTIEPPYVSAAQVKPKAILTR